MDNATPQSVTPAKILLAEDNPGDVRLTKEALNDGKIANELYVVGDGIQALNFLRRKGEYSDAPTPDLILMDLNMPRMDGREALAEIKSDDALKVIPIVILTSSAADQDILSAYNLHANCYITKPVDLEQFMDVVQKIEDFWFTLVRVPNH